MMRSQRKTIPLVVLLGFEVAAIVGLQAAGTSHSMQIPWGDLSTWLDTSSIDQLVPPVVRLTALVLAYWMLVSTALCVIAQVSRIQSAIRATSVFALPSVRRVVDGAMVMSIATTSLVGVTGTAAFAADQPSAPAPTDINTTLTLGAPSSDDLSVPTPTVDGSSTTTTDPSAVTTTGSDDSTTATSAPDDSSVTTAPDGSTPAADDSTTTTADDSSDTTAAPDTTTSTSTDPAASDDTGSDFVPTPSPGVPDASTPSTTAPVTTTTSVPQGPSTPAVTTPDATAPDATTAPDSTAPSTQPQDHRVVAGENLWTIARDTVAASSNTPASQVGEGQIRDYWLKLVDANRDNLRSKDPHWIFPGEVVTLPSLDSTATAGS